MSPKPLYIASFFLLPVTLFGVHGLAHGEGIDAYHDFNMRNELLFSLERAASIDLSSTSELDRRIDIAVVIP